MVKLKRHWGESVPAAWQVWRRACRSAWRNNLRMRTWKRPGKRQRRKRHRSEKEPRIKHQRKSLQRKMRGMLIVNNNLWYPCTDVYEALYTRYFPEFCEKKTQGNHSGGIRTHKLCIARADVIPRDNQANLVSRCNSNAMCLQRVPLWFDCPAF